MKWGPAEHESETLTVLMVVTNMLLYCMIKYRVEVLIFLLDHSVSHNKKQQTL